VKTNDRVAMTTDMWTGTHKKQVYFSFTVQFVEDYAIKCKVKQCRSYCEILRPMIKTAENIKN